MIRIVILSEKQPGCLCFPVPRSGRSKLFFFSYCFFCLLQSWRVSAGRDTWGTFTGVWFSPGEGEVTQLLCPRAENAMLTAEECVPFPTFSIKHEREMLSVWVTNIIHRLFSPNWIARPLLIFKEWGFAQIREEVQAGMVRLSTGTARMLVGWDAAGQSFPSKTEGALWFLAIRLHLQSHGALYLSIS